MRWLYRSRVELLDNVTTINPKGGGSSQWVKITEMIDPKLNAVGEMMCRLDLLFMRPGKDQPMAVEADVIPPRSGVMFCSYSPLIKAGMYVKCISGPVMGTFEIRMPPDVAQNSTRTPHHIETFVHEVAQSAIRSNFPSKESEPR